MYQPPNEAAARTSFADPSRAGSGEPEFSFAFQPIVNAAERRVISFEALVRGPCGEPASEVFARVSQENLHGFDQACRLKAIRMATRLNLRASLNINFFPGSVKRSCEYVKATLEASWEAGFPVERLVFELTETEFMQRGGSVEGIFDSFATYGFQTAIDDFGTGFSGLCRLAEYQPDYVKLDRNLIAGIHSHRVKQVLVKGIRNVCNELCIAVVAEGVEKVEEYSWLRQAGIHIFQGYYFAEPAFESLAEVEPTAF